MKTGAYILICVYLLCSCSGPKPDGAPDNLMEASKQELAAAVSERDKLFSLVRDVTCDLEEIRRLEGLLSATDKRGGEDSFRRSRILADIASVKATLQKRNRQISEMESRLKESSLFNEGLQSTIDILRKQVNSQLFEIEELNRQLTDARRHIGSLNITVDSLSSTVATAYSELDSAKSVSVKLENELNASYVILDSKANLKKQGIIETGFLRKTKVLKDGADKSRFRTCDKRTTEYIRIGAKKPKILTQHPEKSYSMSGKGERTFLHILDSDLFWSLSNYLVIQTD